MSKAYHKVWIGNKLHIMNNDAYKAHMETTMALKNAMESQVETRERFCKDRNKWMPVDRLGNYIDRHSED